MDGKTLYDIHYLQGKHRQQKQRVPDSLKLERNAVKKRKGDGGGEAAAYGRVSNLARVPVLERRRRRRRVSEALDDVLKKMKLKRGNLQLELIRVFVQRQVEKRKQKELIDNAVGNETRQLPHGVMPISPSPNTVLKVNENPALDVKLGVESCSISCLQRNFRSKNIEPLPISTMQAVFLLSYRSICGECEEKKD